MYIALELIRRDGGLSTLCHSCRFACQQRVLKTFPGPGYFHSDWFSLTVTFTGKFVYIYIYIYICIYMVLDKIEKGERVGNIGGLHKLGGG